MSDERPTDPRLSRRQLAAISAGGVASAALGRVGLADAAGARSVDVVVIGAGLAGLTAAIAAKGHSVALLEARNRVGGRTFDHSIGGGKIVEMGGEWAGPGQDKVLALAKELGIKTFETYADGNNLYYRNGTIFKKRKGPDKKIATVDTLETGAYSHKGALKQGTYYASAEEYAPSTGGICKKATSPTLKVG